MDLLDIEKNTRALVQNEPTIPITEDKGDIIGNALFVTIRMLLESIIIDVRLIDIINTRMKN